VVRLSSCGSAAALQVSPKVMRRSRRNEGRVLNDAKCVKV
jgi:hypothetical protein